MALFKKSPARGTYRIFRNQETSLMSGGFALSFAIFAFVSLWFPLNTWQKLLWCSGFAALSVAVAWRWGRQGIYVDEKGIELRGGFTSRYVDWSEIKGFELRRGSLWRDVFTHVDLVDGSSVPAHALNAGSGLLPSMRKRAQNQVDELNQLLTEARSRAARLKDQVSQPRT